MNSIIAKVLFTKPDYETGLTEPIGFVVATEEQIRMHSLSGQILFQASWEEWWWRQVVIDPGEPKMPEKSRNRAPEAGK